jgi:peptidoglycan-associated lipoprotein
MRHERLMRQLRPPAIATGGLVLALALTGCPDKKLKYPACAGDKDCKEGEHCIAKKCVQCGDDSHCAESERCVDGACVKREGWCDGDDDCSDHKVCQEHACVACQSDDECAGGRCVDGACLRPGDCLRDEDCEDDEDCVAGRCQRTGVGTAPPPAVKCKLAIIYFDFDTAAIREDGRAPLTANAECLETSERSVYLIGHTDNRGTGEYNIALSDGRARSVADYLARLGIDPARFRIIPKGEAESRGYDETSWTQDRRVELEWE